MAHDNYSHFAWHNITKYIEMHGKALWFARLAHLKCSDEQKKQDKKGCKDRAKQSKKIVEDSEYDERLSRKYRKLPKLFPRKKFSQRYFNNMSKQRMVRLAIFANAFADHYLSDAFSAGHLRVPRSQIDSFVMRMEDPERNKEGNKEDKKTDKEKERGKGSAVSGALTQFLHNNDGTMTGIKVTNSLGDKFVIRSDKQLFAKMGGSEMSGIVEQNVQLKQPSDAIYKSLKEVFDVIEKGDKAMPKGAYAAFYNVPYIIDEKQSLNQVIQDNIEQKGSIKQAIKSMSQEMQWVFNANTAFGDMDYKQYFSKFIEGIPAMMDDLQEQIKRESQKSEIKKRIPAKLLAALKKIN